jgi:hypothetical protein
VILRVHSHGIEQFMPLFYSMTLYVVEQHDTVCDGSALTTAERRRRSNDAMSHAVTESPFAGLATPDGDWELTIPCISIDASTGFAGDYTIEAGSEHGR